MITVEEHRAAVVSGVAPLGVRRVALREALGCVLAEDVTASLAVPPFDNSAMDGYAVRAGDVAEAGEEAPVRLRVVGDVPAGSAERPEVLAGTAARIMTGAPMPPGADAVVPVERTDQPVGPGPGRQVPDAVAIHAPAGAHVRRAGEDVTAGDVVLRAGVELGPRHLSTAASTGHDTLAVRPRARLGVLSTGDELVPPGEPLGPGQIPDSNSTLLLTLAESLGATAVPLGSVGDAPEELRDLLADNLERVDAIVTTGGVSAGAFDVVKEVLGPLGDVTFSSVAMQPGKPQGFGVLSRSGDDPDDGPGDGDCDAERRVPVFCLPGNPVSVFVSFVVFVDPALRVMSGRGTPDEPASLRPVLLEAVAASGWRCPPGRRQYMPVVLERPADDRVLVRPANPRGSGSHLVASLAAADALAVVEADVDSVAEGDVVSVMMVP
ncbi:molybdopterin molybdotransferase MoeA [Georgenia halophila]|uniref:Molybdopterin molybdenumtransferase n=1 Tax=Georgenia halophila TaxID=620889 RepID=A0ABP8LDK3_9MICO